MTFWIKLSEVVSVIQINNIQTLPTCKLEPFLQTILYLYIVWENWKTYLLSQNQIKWMRFCQLLTLSRLNGSSGANFKSRERNVLLPTYIVQFIYKTCTKQHCHFHFPILLLNLDIWDFPWNQGILWSYRVHPRLCSLKHNSACRQTNT